MFNINNGCKSKFNLLQSICVYFDSSFVYMSAYANVYCKTICKCIRQSIFIGPRSIAEVPFDSARHFRATLLLRTTCMRLWGNWVASCVVALQTKNQKIAPPTFCLVAILIERNPPPREDFLFIMFPHQEPCVRGPPSKELYQVLRGGSSYTRFLDEGT